MHFSSPVERSAISRLQALGYSALPWLAVSGCRFSMAQNGCCIDRSVDVGLPFADQRQFRKSSFSRPLWIAIALALDTKIPEPNLSACGDPLSRILYIATQGRAEALKLGIKEINEMCGIK